MNVTDPTPWLHESGSRHSEDYEAPVGVVFWMPREDSAQREDSP